MRKQEGISSPSNLQTINISSSSSFPAVRNTRKANSSSNSSNMVPLSNSSRLNLAFPLSSRDGNKASKASRPGSRASQVHLLVSKLGCQVIKVDFQVSRWASQASKVAFQQQHAPAASQDFQGYVTSKLQQMVATNRLQAFYPPQRLQQVVNKVLHVDLR